MADEQQATETTTTTEAPRRGRGGDRGGDRGGREGRGRGDGRGRREEKDSDLIDKLVHINRVAKVVKGGRRFGFAALVVVGDGNGKVGFGHGKAREVPEAIRKATEEAKKSMVRIPLKEGRTLHHEVRGHHGAGKVLVRPAPAGTGIIAGGPMRAVFEALGVGDVVSKSLGTSNPYNMVRATFDALKNQQSPRMVAQRRGRSVADILAKREDAPAAEANA
jgi:small subunit ribosomal protein S5